MSQQLQRDNVPEIRNPSSPASAFSTSEKWLISDEALARFHERAPGYDRDNAFFTEDLAELREAGYLVAPLPAEFGGGGMPLSQVVREQRRLAYWAPATALAINMHLYWAAGGTMAFQQGQTGLRWLLEAIANGAVAASGHGEAGNDAGFDDSLTSAVPQGDGGYAFTGRKTFTSLSPAWTLLGLHGRDDSDPEHPKLVHAFINRDTVGVSTVKTWDALGVRATASDDTLLDGAVAPAHQIAAFQEIGHPYPPFLIAILSCYLPLLANVYFGIARRALDLAITQSQTRASRALPGQFHADKPAVQRQVAQAEIAMDAAWSLLEKAVADFEAHAPYGDWWLARLFTVKEFATATAVQVVDTAVQVVGASSVSKRNELERLYRDVRTGPLHPPNTDLVLDVIGKAAFGRLP